jgi:SAM-dependent methyltransferase
MSFHHWGDQAGGIRQVARVLRPGGIFVLADVDVPLLFLMRPLRRWIDHVHFQEPQAIQRLLEQAGFSVVSQRRFWRVLRVQVVVARKN